MDEFKLLAQKSFNATWCDGQQHVSVAGLRDVHDFRAAEVSVAPCDCQKAEQAEAA